MELHVNMLACVTRHWMRSDDYLNIYGWWPGADDPPVVIFSCAGFDALPAAGPVTDRAIANVMVSGLAGYLAQMDSHERGAKDCPMAFNAKRALEYVAGPQAFDRSCRAKLAAKIPRDLPALEALLKVFPPARGEPAAGKSNRAAQRRPKTAATGRRASGRK